MTRALDYTGTFYGCLSDSALRVQINQLWERSVSATDNADRAGYLLMRHDALLEAYRRGLKGE